MRTAVVILNWNTRKFLHDWLPSLLESCRGRDAEVIVADSCSTDGSLQMLTEEFPEVRQIPLDRNYGFTGGYNRALAQVEAEFYVLINSDVEAGPDWLDALLAWMDSHPRCGICGPKLLSMGERNRFEYAGAAGGYLDFFGLPYCRGRVLGKTVEDRGQYDSPAPVSWVSGACLMVRSSVWKELGGLDDRFFAHMEEIDFCWRARAAGHEVWCVPQSFVFHLGGGTLPQKSPRKLFLNFRNNLLMLRGNLPAPRRFFLIPARMVFDGLVALGYLLSLRPSYTKAVFDAHCDYRRLRKSAPDRTRRINLLGCRLVAIEYLRLK